MTHRDLIAKAASMVRPRPQRGGLVGDVGGGLVAEDGTLYLGVCADIGSNVFCAEQNAIGSTLTDGVSKIRTIVATWRDESGATYVIAPCGNGRQFMLDIDESNLDCGVILDADRVVKLRALLPDHDSWRRQ